MPATGLFQGVLPLMLKLYTKAQARLATAKDRGATAVEYGLMVALIAAVIVIIVAALGSEIRNAFDHTCDRVAAGSPGGANSCSTN